MSELTDLILQTTDPVSAVLLLVVAGYLRQIKTELRAEIERVRQRTERLEGQHLPGHKSNDDD